MTWDAVALETGTDKSSAFHNYCGVYEDQISQRSVDRLLEIGVAGGRSLALWRAVLPDAFIVGVDTNDACMAHQRPGCAVLLADAANAAQMAAVSTLYGPFDVVIDDGSHILDDVRAAFEELYPRLASGGLYVIEDLDGADEWVLAFVERWNAAFWPIPVRPSLNGAFVEPGLIVVEASW